MVPFVRVTRDKRGYEHICLMRASGRRGKGGAPRILYVFRTPPGVKVGREPFDETARRTIEEQNPGVFFDWKKLSVIAPPAPDVEYWRERRRAEKAAKQALRAEERDDAARQAGSTAVVPAVEPVDPVGAVDDVAEDEPGEEPEPSADEVEMTVSPAAGTDASGPPQETASSAPQGHRRRRRRRGGRGRKRHPRPEGLAQVPADSPKVTDDSSKER